MIRLALGAVFVVHGIPKLLYPGDSAPFFGQIGIPAPAVTALVVGAIELIGGILLVIGFGTRAAAALLAVDMLGAIILVKFRTGFVGGWEFDLVLLAGALSLVLSAPGSAGGLPRGCGQGQ